MPGLERAEPHTVTRRYVPKYSFRWRGYLELDGKYRIWMPGSIAQWFYDGETVVWDGKTLYRSWDGELFPVWPPFSKVFTLDRKSPLSGKVVYRYRILVEEAVRRREFEQIVELEQYHYASKKETVAIWACPKCGKLIESNTKPLCDCGGEAVLIEIKGSLPVSRFLVLKLLDRQPFEPEVVGYVRIDPPVPLMHRRVDGEIQKFIRERVFPESWFHPTYWPAGIMRELMKRMSRREAFGVVWKKAVEMCNTAAARISRVVIHPDYRGDGLGMLAVRAAIEWIRERRVPEMKKRKHLVETIAQMARYTPFFEKVGFKYLWDTASGRPVLYYPLTTEAERYIDAFLRKDPIAKKHGGRLFVPHYRPADPISGPIVLRNVFKAYRNELDLSHLREELREVLEAFGVEKRVVEKYVLRGANLEISPGELVVVVGASGAGKTTLLRILSGLEAPDAGDVVLPPDARLAVLIPWEHEPNFGNEPLLEHMYTKLGDVVAAIEVLNLSGLSDAIFYRASFSQLSTGQKERAKLASILADRPNVLIIDEFAAHLDVLIARRVARKLAQLCRRFGITAVIVTHRPEIIDALEPDRILYVGYGGIYCSTTKPSDVIE